MSHSAPANLHKSALVELEKASENADYRTFALLTRTIDWSTHGAAELTRAIDLALALDMAMHHHWYAHGGPEDDQRGV